ncbi:DUF411 domain-containing protein [Thalassotalea sp. Y01]|uniref:DUF411 domain-containing protein n=1 Tax=Thalassotalea sp. Y01 TaxID=2729613 RepID=UPI00145EA7D1|nr:DUF411 domain-containing protein [Thalassotalea sp. Y01]NMP14973.1 DUF411 domain-containing protein [Thalassotalea sp. Y01]
MNYSILKPFLLLLACFSFNLAVASENAQAPVNKNTADAVQLLVFKSPSCGCCQKWIDHINNNHFQTQVEDTDAMDLVKNKLGITPNMRSCHTAVSRDGFAFEGHVPAKYIHKFLNESHANAIGLSVPAMPVGSPGMEVGDKFMPYQIMILFKDGSSKVYARINSYEEQF